MRIDTKPCPFCGETVDIDLSIRDCKDKEGTPVALYCGSCGAIGPWGYEQNQSLFFEQAKNLWNDRNDKDNLMSLDILQKYIGRGDSLKKFKDGTYKLTGLEGIIAEGETLKELVINLIKK